MAKEQEAQVEMAFAKPNASPCSNSASAPSPLPRSFRRSELSLRLVSFVASVAGFAFLITDHQSRSFAIFQSVITQEARFSDMKALVYSIVSLGIVALYSISQVARCLLCSFSSSSSSLSWAVFLLDQVMTYFLLTSSAAAAQSAYFSEQGNDGLKWVKVCYLYERFCKQVGTGIISSFVAFLALVFTSGISAFNLFASTNFDV